MMQNTKPVPAPASISVDCFGVLAKPYRVTPGSVAKKAPSAGSEVGEHVAATGSTIRPANTTRRSLKSPGHCRLWPAKDETVVQADGGSGNGVTSSCSVQPFDRTMFGLEDPSVQRPLARLAPLSLRHVCARVPE
jgi:hypothetical protein